MIEQANLPGTVDTHPNWRRKLPVTVNVLADDPGPANHARGAAVRRRAPAVAHDPARAQARSRGCARPTGCS